MCMEEKLDYFLELIRCNYNVYLWRYQPNLTLEYTDCPDNLITSDVMSFLNFADSLVEYAKSGGCLPFILDTPMTLIWIAAFERENNELKKIHLIGPAFTGKNSHIILKKELDKRELSVSLRSLIFQQVETIPIIPTTTLFQYTIMFHYCVTNEKISSYDIQFPKTGNHEPLDDVNLITEEHRGVWMAEQKLLAMIRDGNPNYKDALENSSSLSYGIKFDIGNPIRQQKNSVHALLTLSSRAAIEGGLNPSISYTLSDYYTLKIELCQTTSELSLLSRAMLDDYVLRVQQTKKNSLVSKQIRNICDYIDMHITEKLTIQHLAEQAGYTEYYFSQKFKKEMDCSVNEYITRKKVEQSKTLLSATKMSILEISEELSFGSRSYFFTSFRKYTGVSPSEYREQNLKI